MSGSVCAVPSTGASRLQSRLTSCAHFASMCLLEVRFESMQKIYRKRNGYTSAEVNDERPHQHRLQNIPIANVCELLFYWHIFVLLLMKPDIPSLGLSVWYFFSFFQLLVSNETEHMSTQNEYVFFLSPTMNTQRRSYASSSRTTANCNSSKKKKQIKPKFNNFAFQAEYMTIA